ncbi:MAG: putative transaldolase [Nitrospirales bacterium]|nr:MAG: putative transaldolase [Nitrospirales bacterium]
MKTYLQTASIREIQEAASFGILDGITTNAYLMSKETKSYSLYEGLQEICRFVDVPICVGGLSVEAEAMVKEGKELASVHQNIVVKCPLTSDGLKASQRLAAEGIRVNVTLCCSVNHALLAAHAGAWYVSSFMGCLGDNSVCEIDVIGQMATLFRHYGITSRVFLASVQDPQHVIKAASVGVHICGVPFSVMKSLMTSRYMGVIENSL